MTPPAPPATPGSVGANLPRVSESFKVIWDTCQSVRTFFKRLWVTLWLTTDATGLYLWCKRSRQEIVKNHVLGVRGSGYIILTKYKQPTGSTRKVSITDPGLSSVKGKCPKWDNLFPIRPVPSCSNGHWLFFFADFCWDTRNFHALKWLLIIVEIVEPR